MIKKSTLLALSIVIAAGALTACNKAATPAVSGDINVQEAEKNTFKAPALPSIYENADYKDLALAVDASANALLKTAKDTKDLEKLKPLIIEFVQKRDLLLTKITNNEVRQAAFSEVMKKNMATNEDREAYAAVMTMYYQQNKNSGTVQNVKNTPPVAKAEKHTEAAPKK